MRFASIDVSRLQKRERWLTVSTAAIVSVILPGSFNRPDGSDPGFADSVTSCQTLHVFEYPDEFHLPMDSFCSR